MSYRIEITADTLAELAGKAASLAAKLNTPDQGVLVEQPTAPIAAFLKLGALKEKLDQELAEAAPAAPAPEPEAPAADVPDFDAVVTPLVLKLVEVKGKPAAQEVLGRFGVIKASQLSSDKWAELVDAINDELAA